MQKILKRKAVMLGLEKKPEAPGGGSSRLALYGFNNLTKTLSFNIYDVCYAKSEREQKDRKPDGLGAPE